MGYREGVERVEPRIFCKIESKEEERGGRSIIGQTIALWYLLVSVGHLRDLPERFGKKTYESQI